MRSSFLFVSLHFSFVVALHIAASPAHANLRVIFSFYWLLVMRVISAVLRGSCLLLVIIPPPTVVAGGILFYC